MSGQYPSAMMVCVGSARHIQLIAIPSVHASGVRCVAGVVAMQGPPDPVDAPVDAEVAVDVEADAEVELPCAAVACDALVPPPAPVVLDADPLEWHAASAESTAHSTRRRIPPFGRRSTRNARFLAALSV